MKAPNTVGATIGAQRDAERQTQRGRRPRFFIEWDMWTDITIIWTCQVWVLQYAHGSRNPIPNMFHRTDKHTFRWRCDPEVSDRAEVRVGRAPQRSCQTTPREPARSNQQRLHSSTRPFSVCGQKKARYLRCSHAESRCGSLPHQSATIFNSSCREHGETSAHSRSRKTVPNAVVVQLSQPVQTRVSSTFTQGRGRKP